MTQPPPGTEQPNTPAPTSRATVRPWCWEDWGPADLPLELSAEPLVDQGLRHARAAAPLAGRLHEDPWPTWQWLAGLGAVDLTVARAAEPHLDALDILAQASLSPTTAGCGEDATFGVWAARAPGLQLHGTQQQGSWRLDGDKPWCSLAGTTSHALVSATTDDGDQLFLVGLDQPGVRSDAAAWHPRGLVDITTSTVHFDGVAATAVGGPGWYLSRPGFAWGGIGVAAVWFGAAAALAGSLVAAAGRREPDQLMLAHLGACDRELTAALATLRHAAREVAAGTADDHAARLAVEVRSVVADAAEAVLREVGHATGPAPLAMDPEHAARVADLTLYLRQHHAGRDLARLGAMVLEATR